MTQNAKAAAKKKAVPTKRATVGLVKDLCEMLIDAREAIGAAQCDTLRGPALPSQVYDNLQRRINKLLTAATAWSETC